MDYTYTFCVICTMLSFSENEMNDCSLNSIVEVLLSSTKFQTSNVRVAE